MNTNIKGRASDKAFAKIHFTKMDVDRLNKELKSGMAGIITLEQTEICLEATKRELKVWNYIASLIEKDI